MAQFEQHFVQDLTQQIKVRHCGSIVFNADNESNVVSVRLFNGSEPVAISGSVVGAVVCSDGSTVPLTGSYSGNTASITLTGDCFAVLGQIGVGIQIVNGTQKTTVLKVIYNVETLTTENVVDPGSRITLEVGDLIAAIDEAVATIPEDYSALTSEVEDIKAVNKIFNRDVVGVPNPIDTATWIDNANLNDSGAVKAAQGWKVTQGYIETSADSYKISYNNSETSYIVQVAGYTSSGSFVRMFANAESSSGVRSFTIDTTSVDKIRIATRYGNPILSVYPNDGKIVEKLASVEDDVSDLKSQIDSMTTATAEDEGKALKAKTVADGKVTEWEFGDASGAMYTTENINLVDLSKWTTGNNGQSDFIPVENGKSYTANFAFYNNRLFAYTASKESLGSLDAYNGFSRVESFSVYKSKNVITISSNDVAYIKFQNMGRPAAGSWIVEGNIDMPLEFEDEVLVAKQPELDNTRDLMLQEKPIELGELEDALRQRIKMLGFDNQPLSIADVYGYDAETFPFKIEDANLMVGDSSIFKTADTTALLFNHEVNSIKFSFASQIIDNSNYKRNPMVVLQSNQNEHKGRLISFNATGRKPNGIGYIYQWNQDESVQSASNQYSFVHEYTFVSFEIVRNTDSFDIEMIDTEGTKVTRHFTFAQMGVTDADRLGLLYQKNANYLDDLLLAFDVSLSGQPSVGSSSKESPLNGVTYDAWGDSYTAPVGSYAAIIAEKVGCTVNNLGNSGDKVTSVLTRFNNRSDACGDYVSILAGVNDYLHDTTMENFRTSVQSFITAVITKAPSAKFLWITPAQIGSQGENSLDLTLEDYVDAIVEICGKNSVPVFDLYHSGGWYGNVSAFQQIYMSTDLLHPNNVGQTFLAGKIQKALEML